MFDKSSNGSFNQSFDNKGFAGGGQAGCQLQTGMFLWGLEGDWSSFSNSTQPEYLQLLIDRGGRDLDSKCEPDGQL